MKKYTITEIKEWLLKEYGFIYVSGELKGITSVITCKDKDGYLYLCRLQKMKYRYQSSKMVHSNNPYSIDNIKLFVQNKTNNEFSCISSEYINNQTELEFIHNRCGRTFKNKWINIARGRYDDNAGINKTGLFCPHCNTKQLESTHALVLKQVWLHEESDTIVEERSCINPKTNCSLPTDIVNHRLKIAIEIQSWFHDFEDQQIKDEIKKEYWINKGYHFYAVDQRDYTVLEMINLFFPKIKEIPNYIDFDYSNKFDDVKAQKLLNYYLSVNKVSEIMGCRPHKIYDAIQNGRITYPDNYKYNHYTAIVQLSLQGEYIAEFDTIAEAQRANNIKYISAALHNHRNYCGGYYWVKSEDYHSGNYHIKPTKYKIS